MIVCTKKTVELKTKVCEDTGNWAAESAAKNGLTEAAWLRGWVEHIRDRKFAYPHKYEKRKK